MKSMLKGAAVIIGVAVILLAIAGFVVSSIGKSKFSQTYEVSVALLSSAPADSASLARGAHLASINGCYDCHGENLGGRVFVDDPPFRVTASNLTAGRGGIGASYSVEDWDRTIRYGVRPEGRAVVIMPSKTFHNLNDEDAASLIAFLQSLPPIDNELPPTELRTLGTILIGAGEVDVTSAVHTSASRPAPVEPGETAAYGGYLSSITCIYCHGADLTGGPPVEPEAPPAPALANAASWTVDVFINTIRTGVRPDGIPMNPLYMPWTAFRHMTDMELKAIHMYMQSL